MELKFDRSNPEHWKLCFYYLAQCGGVCDSTSSRCLFCSNQPCQFPEDHDDNCPYRVACSDPLYDETPDLVAHYTNVREKFKGTEYQ